IKAAGKAARVRLTVIGEDGWPLADSDAEVRNMANHKDRPEVIEALEKGEASSTRTSGSVNRELRYVAVRIPGTKAVARAALDERDVEERVGPEAGFPWGAGTAATLVGALAAALLLAPTAAGVRGVARALGGLAEGDLAARVPVRGPDFLRGLSTAFNSMS